MPLSATITYTGIKYFDNEEWQEYEGSVEENISLMDAVEFMKSIGGTGITYKPNAYDTLVRDTTNLPGEFNEFDSVVFTMIIHSQSIALRRILDRQLGVTL